MDKNKKQKQHDVFLSFRGEDTRNSFSSHLREALSQRSIETFLDENLERGKDVWIEIAKAIKVSRLSIVVFSENYAASTWCLKELVQILECRKKQNQIVIPVFYQVNPSDVRKHTGNYRNAFAKHEQDPKGEETESKEEKISKWKTALTDAANISGWHCPRDKNQTVVIKEIVNRVWEMLHLPDPTAFNVRDESVVVIKEEKLLHLREPSTALKGPVRHQENFTKVESFLNTDDKVIGIWGKEGIGKSTIAEVLSAERFSRYDHVCVVNAKESPNWLNKLFSELSKEELVSQQNVDITRLISHMQSTLSSKKIFIVLDDVTGDSLDSLEYLHGEYRNQHSRSRLVITTRDKHLLEGRVNGICELKEWENPQSLNLFCLEAFNKKSPQRGYESLSARAVQYAGGVPLALRVLGSHFRKKPTEFWESTLKELHKYPQDKTRTVLEVSYTELHDLEKNIFLDVAFFFKEKQKDHVLRILEACGFEPTIGIENLARKALLSVSKSKIIQMHDLIQEMGLEIVRLEDRYDLGKRSRLKDNDAREVIENNKGTNAIQGIALDLSQIENLPLRVDTFTKMKSLRFIKFYNTLGQSSTSINTYLNLPATLESFSDQLRYIEWFGYPFESLPSSFYAELLVEIHMPHSKVKQLWQGVQELNNLERIELSGCKQFEKVPDLSKAQKLRWVNLSYCESLHYLHPSVLSSDTLVTLILDGCTRLKSVKGKHVKSLKEISVTRCLSMKEFAVSSDLIEILDLSNTGIQRLGTQIGRMKKLWRLNLEGLRLGHFVKELSWLTSLKELMLCDTLAVIEKEKLRVLFDGTRSLEKLHMKDMCNLFELPDNISALSKLQELRLDGSNVKSLPEIEKLEMLEILSLENCELLHCLPKLPSRIKYLGAINCESLTSVSNLNTLATKMWGMAKFITFKNSLKLVGGRPWELITESIQLTMMHAVFDNVRSRHIDSHGYNYTSVQLCLPGNMVPSQIKYQATESSITVKLPVERSSLMGFIYTVVVGEMGTKKQKIKCKCLLPIEGMMEEAWLDSDIEGLESDHVYVWYDPLHCDSILKYHDDQPEARFEFCVADDNGEVDDGSICIKKCGIRLVTYSEVPVVLDGLKSELDSDTRKTMDWTVQRMKADTDRRHGTKSNTEIVELDSAEEGNDERKKSQYSDVEESFKSTHKETDTDSATNDSRQNTRGSTEKSISEREDGATTEGRDQISKSKSTEVLSEPTVEKRPNVEAENQEQPIIEPEDKSRTEEAKVDPGERVMNDATCAPDHVLQDDAYTNTPINLEDCMNQVDQNPFIMIDFMSMSSKQYFESSDQHQQQSLTKYDGNFEVALEELRELAFSQSMTKNVKDAEFGKKLEAAVQKLENFPQELNEELNGKIKSFFDLYKQACENVKEQEVTRDTITRVTTEKDADLNKLKTAWSRVNQLKYAILEREPKIEGLRKKETDFNNKIKKLQEELKIEELRKHETDFNDKINKLQEELSGVEKDKARLEAAQAENVAEKTHVFASAKHVSTNLGRLLKQEKELDEAQAKLDREFQALKRRYNKMRVEPPF